MQLGVALLSLQHGALAGRGQFGDHGSVFPVRPECFTREQTTSPIRIFGFKGEGNFVQIWVRDAVEFFLLGYGGNASPFPLHCPYPPSYAQYPPSLIRIERTPHVTLGNIMVQEGARLDLPGIMGGAGAKPKGETACGLFDTGFAGEMYDPRSFSVLFEGNSSVAPMLWPTMYTRRE
eukprot:CAMPEP_0175985146 /NCGR_PEP_ID=MMETSP0108-20121206/49397_1 /TAXON_ID=195067 ORGANISM="Goniomonas pacifica, Strain CCMP1869" /NCGR_SAMPLE_ID=MMETSP0108 /ASSEMBLY_ACC=CAM_ASM_000204 /LENGTH=176 /DNA_ID=CAMNT_0017316091 /DNA_START=61 /DNA_END=590 /DNA_ORIENTATION=+